jgi:hypothetical protein
MPFSLKTVLPLYVGADGITIRITAPGSASRLNGDADDSMADDEDGLFEATVAENLVGTFTYLIYRSGTPIQIGWMKRLADQATVVLDDPRDFGSDGSSPEVTVAVSIPAIEAESIVLDAEVTKYRGTLWTFMVEGLVAIPAKAYWTIKRSTESDAKATLQVVARNPTVDGDGLKILNGVAVATGEAARGSITYETYTVSGNTRYRAILQLLPTSSAAIIPDFYKLDLKDVTADADAILAECVLRVVNPVTLATS